MFQLKTIGKIVEVDGSSVIQVHKSYQNALKHIDNFSHIHVFYVYGCGTTSRMDKAIFKIDRINFKEGTIVSSTKVDITTEWSLIDIKPYFPCEDSVEHFKEDNKCIDNFMGIEVTDCKVNTSDMSNGDNDFPYEVMPIGLIRNTNGNSYIELYNTCSINCEYIKIFWWFHKFEESKYRRATLCNPPYEDAPKTGIFATRSPVRPNPIAMTVARVVKIDQLKNRIYINGIESFDKTPCIGVQAYSLKKDLVTDCMVPEWLEHWPKWFDSSNPNDSKQDITIKNSELKKLLDEEGRYEMNASTKEIDKRTTVKDGISVHGARENNLKSININIPYRKITAVVGVSGSGKSSLVYDTIYSECRRRMEYLTPNRNLLQKPKVDDISGCIPAVIITQDPIRGNLFSTVGTYTNAYDYLRILYASVSVRHCPNCGNEIIPLSQEAILSLLSKHKDVKICDLDLEEVNAVNLEKKIDLALEKGKGAFYAKFSSSDFILLQTKQKCYHCNRILFEITPSIFSYMDTDSRCPTCNGTGKIVKIDTSKIIDNKELSLLDGAISLYGKLRMFKQNPNANWMKGQIFGLAEAMNVDLEKPWNELPYEFREKVLNGSEEEVTFSYVNKKNGRTGEITRPVEGVCQIIERLYEENANANTLDKYMSKVTCETCHGERLNREGRMTTIEGFRYPEVAQMSFYEVYTFCKKLENKLSGYDYSKVESVIKSLKEVADMAINLGIGHLQLSQETSTLSGGEGQRVKLLGAAFNQVTGILYIFDEPSKGLHSSDYQKVIRMLYKLKEDGNTIIIVEHNEDMIRIADYVVEIGPGAGIDGGMLVGSGTLEAMMNHKGTQISKYMNEITKDIKKDNNLIDGQVYIHMENLIFRNLKNIGIRFPKRALTCITGVSGSGKSSMMKGEIYNRAKNGSDFSDVILVDQQPIGKTSKSIIATYINIMDYIRTTFATSDMALENGWDESYFSFNTEMGQCKTCKGEGKINIKYIENTWVTCPDCKGRRYKTNILKVHYNSKNIDEVLKMSINEAIAFYSDNKEIKQKLISLQRVGLGYLALGQGTSTLSGGESSRLKLAKELIIKNSSNILYLLDEPTTGLHFSDIDHLKELISDLIHTGNTVVAIEHNRQFNNSCDWIIELGPGAGKDGGEVIHQGEV